MWLLQTDKDKKYGNIQDNREHRVRMCQTQIPCAHLLCHQSTLIAMWNFNNVMGAEGGIVSCLISWIVEPIYLRLVSRYTLMILGK